MPPDVQAPDNAGHHHNIAPLWLAQGNVEAAIYHYRRAMQLNPQDNGSRNDLAVVLWKRGKWEAALAALRQVLNINPDHFQGHINICAVYYSKGQYDLALKHARKAVSLHPADPRGHRVLGNVLDQMGNSTEAVHYRKVAVLRGPGMQGIHQKEDSNTYRKLAIQLISRGGPERESGHAHMDAYRALSRKRVELANSERTKEILERALCKG
ncbi:unnamed protein product [Discosporangium mesarthrocarpum]